MELMEYLLKLLKKHPHPQEAITYEGLYKLLRQAEKQKVNDDYKNEKDALDAMNQWR